jgi:hypothetical protein
VRLVAYVWAMPLTLIGLLLASFALGGGGIRIVAGVIEAHGPLLRWGLRYLIPIPGGAAAITIGHVVLGRDANALEWSRSHERVHVGQYEHWGLLFIPAYLAASAWQFARGRHFYFDNCFEREARRSS